METGVLNKYLIGSGVLFANVVPENAEVKVILLVSNFYLKIFVFYQIPFICVYFIVLDIYLNF